MINLVTVTTVFLLVLSGPAVSQPATPVTGQLVEQCVMALEACEEKAMSLDTLVQELMDYKKVCETEIEVLKSGDAELEKAFEFCRNMADLRQQRVDNLTEIERTLSEDREQCYASLEATMDNYRTCVQEATKPWWREALFYLGIVIGLAIGIPI